MASIIGTQLNTHAAKRYGLFIDGLDVLEEPAVPSRYGVSTDSIRVTEAGPGGVSSMSFVIDDPQGVIGIADGATIRYWDLTQNFPMFVGFLESLTLTPDFGQQGRSITITAYGIEAVLDLVIVPALTSTYGDQGWTLGANMTDVEMMQVIGGFTGLRTGSDPVSFVNPNGTGGTRVSSLAGPIGATAYPNGLGGGGAQILLYPPAVVVMDGMTVRQAFEAFRAACVYLDASGTQTAPPPYALTVDFWGGIRLFAFGGGADTFAPSDYEIPTLQDTPTGGDPVAGLTWQQDYSPGAITNAVYVKGAAAASTGWVTGDTSTGRREAYATTSGTTDASKVSAAWAIMSQKQTPAGRGSFTSEANDGSRKTHPGSPLIFTDARINFAGKHLLITAISKTYDEGGTQNWTYSFIDGADTPTAGEPSAMSRMRTLTRGTN